MKLVAEEAGSDALRSFASTRDLISSVVAWVEVPRAGRRYGAEAKATELLERLAQVPLTAEIVEQARDAEPPSLSSLDAIHLASALSLAERRACFVAYDQRLVEAARAAGLDVRSPS